jgi:hypothetical protein
MADDNLTTISVNPTDWWTDGGTTITLGGSTMVWDSPTTHTTTHTYVPPEEFQKQVVELIELLHMYGPKLRLLADVLGAMKIEEEDNNVAG